MNAKQKHTPEPMLGQEPEIQPWAITEIYVQGQPQTVYEVYTDTSMALTRGFVFEERDARLIAAAPTMFDLLQRIADTTCDHGPQDFCPRDEARKVLEAIR